MCVRAHILHDINTPGVPFLNRFFNQRALGAKCRPPPLQLIVLKSAHLDLTA